MYLTQFEFNTRRRHSRFLLSSAERIHAAVLSSFPAATTAAAEGRVLWRLDHGANGRRELWISSPSVPDLSALVEECGWPAAETWRTGNLGSLLQRLQEGQAWRFRLTANPVKGLPAHGSGRGAWVPLTVSGHIPWLQSRALAAGFSVGAAESPTATVTRSEDLRFSKSRGGQVSLRLAQFDGILRVEDGDLLRRTLTEGLGRGKAYGAGLMTLAPLP